MRDAVITARRIKTESITFLICFLVGNLVNLYAIISYGTSFKELFTQLGYVFIFSVALYGVWSIIRIIYYLIKKLFKTPQTPKGAL